MKVPLIALRMTSLQSNLVQHFLHSTHWSLGNGLEPIDRDSSRLGHLGLICALGTELLHGDTTPRDHGLLSFADPDTGIIVLLVGLISAIRVANLSLKVIMLVSLKLAKTLPVRPLGVSVNVHLDNTILDSSCNLLISGTGATVHDKEDGKIRLTADLFLGVSLVLSKALRLEGDISRLVHTMDIAKGSSNGEHRANLGEGLIDCIHLLRSSVKLLRVNILIVHSIFLPSCDANLHLQPDLHLDHALKVLDTDLNVLIIRLFRKVKHVG
mmetsp:Transcript_30637/g.62551  ORF Transcript_30637/g.62551 Transcript_30637/m.62551 type:complete len:269 (+) Transcript_30637:549-1355(+)